MALELIKYQMVVALLFSRYLTPSVIKYDRLFCQAAARDRMMRCDSPNEDIYMWTLSQPNSTCSNLASTDKNVSGRASTSQSFRDRLPVTARLGLPVKPNTPTVDRATHMPSGKDFCERFNLSNALTVKTAGTPTARVCTLAKGAQNSYELQRAHTPLHHSV
jgi:hypothetical protein